MTAEPTPTIERAYRVRLRPTPAQARTLSRLFGARRYVWNWALRRKDAAWRVDGTKLKGTRITLSNRMRRRQRQIGTLHARIGDQRCNHQHQLTARAVAGAQVIAIEDLAVKGLSRSMGRRAFRRSVNDAGLGEIRRQLTYKALWRGRVLTTVDRFYPSSKTCSGCGAVKADLTLKQRGWTCTGCGAHHDRDANAALNIRREGLRLLAEATGPEGHTPRSGGINARGGDACATIKSSIAGQPTPVNRELTYRAAPPRPRRTTREDPGRRREG